MRKFYLYLFSSAIILAFYGCDAKNEAIDILQQDSISYTLRPKHQNAVIAQLYINYYFQLY